jgi:elongator complex protein 3
VSSRWVDREALRLDDLVYPVGDTEEHFLSYVTPEDKLVAFLRLSLPGVSSPQTGLKDLKGAALIREVHVFGQSLPVGTETEGAAQHIGLGRRLIQHAEKIVKAHGFEKVAVISAVGTRQYYMRQGFRRGELYMLKEI